MRRFRFRIGVLCVGSALAAVACGGSSGSGGAQGSEPGDASADAPSDAPSVEPADAPASSDGPSEAASSSEGGAAVSDAGPDADAGGGEGGVAVADAGPDGGEGGSNADAGDGGAPAAVPFIVVDQFGYRPSDSKIAVVRSPQVGFDAVPFTPGSTYALVDSTSGAKVLEGAPVAWNGGATDPSSGDEAWWFDFSGVTTPGSYYVLDETHSFQSPVFEIEDGVYADAIVQAVRGFFYQRDGVAKQAPYVTNPAWQDNAAHPQDAHCALYDASDAGADAAAPYDLHGGWFNAGDQSKYAIWAASNATELLRAYAEAPSAFAGTAGDSYDIPESSNGIPDILDEAKWGLDWLTRMQRADGSVLSIVGAAGASPPSADTSPCLYAPASAASTWAAAAAFAYGAIVLQPFDASYVATLKNDAIAAWSWASANPSVTFANSGLIGTYEQQPDAAGVTDKEVEAAVYLFELTGDAAYKSVIDANYAEVESSFAPSRVDPLDALLEYARTPGATAGTASDIQSTFLSNVGGASVAGTVLTDPYRAYIPSYAFVVAFGSNQPKAGQGNLLYDLASLSSGAGADGGAADGGATGAADASAGDAGLSASAAAAYAEGYVHYFHGVNPLGLVYLSNMESFGATKSLTQIFSQWFGTSTPPPGFIPGGPNPAYAWESCCPSSCDGDAASNESLSETQCVFSSPPSPPYGQPDQKSYRDFGNAWPLDSWLVSEPNGVYAPEYVRLVSKFVP